MKSFLKLPILLVLGVSLAACESLNLQDDETAAGAAGAAETSAAAPTTREAQLLNFVAEGQPGSQESIAGEGDGMMYARIEGDYLSARGRPCRRVALSNGTGWHDRVACRGEDGWHLIEPLRDAAAL